MKKYYCLLINIICLTLLTSCMYSSNMTITTTKNPFLSSMSDDEYKEYMKTLGVKDCQIDGKEVKLTMDKETQQMLCEQYQSNFNANIKATIQATSFDQIEMNDDFSHCDIVVSASKHKNSDQMMILLCYIYATYYQSIKGIEKSDMDVSIVMKTSEGKILYNSTLKEYIKTKD